uniref:Uncharacterized protein n=1 Tax=Magallana gigas TaxID=29159 RepID=K1QJH2_MAGGI
MWNPSSQSRNWPFKNVVTFCNEFKKCLLYASLEPYDKSSCKDAPMRRNGIVFQLGHFYTQMEIIQVKPNSVEHIAKRIAHVLSERNHAHPNPQNTLLNYFKNEYILKHL